MCSVESYAQMSNNIKQTCLCFCRLIFGKMNWTIEEVRKDGMSVRPLDWTFHRTLALAVVEANLKHAPDVVHETGEIFFKDHLIFGLQ